MHSLWLSPASSQAHLRTGLAVSWLLPSPGGLWEECPGDWQPAGGEPELLEWPEACGEAQGFHEGLHSLRHIK